ncbi:MAG: hypothetical protein ACI9MF_002549, partial [Gammaproteobacteria bacterium]
SNDGYILRRRGEVIAFGKKWSKEIKIAVS